MTLRDDIDRVVSRLRLSPVFAYATFKAYYSVAGILFSILEYASITTLLPRSKPSLAGAVLQGLGAGLASWVVLIIAFKPGRKRSQESEFAAAPLAWSECATRGSLTFLGLSACLALPVADFSDPLGITTLALVGIISATAGIVLYLMPALGEVDTKRGSLEAMKAELQTCNLLFTGSIVWVGVFVGGAVLGTSLGAAGNTLRQYYPAVQQGAIERVILYHALMAGYVGSGAILWMLRPLHRRVCQITRAMSRSSDPLHAAGPGGIPIGCGDPEFRKRHALFFERYQNLEEAQS